MCPVLKLIPDVGLCACVMCVSLATWKYQPHSFKYK